MKFVSSQQIFEKGSSIKFHQNPSSGSRVIPCEQTDRWTDVRTDGQDEANSRFLQFSNAFKKDSKCNLDFKVVW